MYASSVRFGDEGDSATYGVTARRVKQTGGTSAALLGRMAKEKAMDRRLEDEKSQAATTPAAEHEDALSPSKAVRESSAGGGGQRLGDSGPVANPITTFPETEAREHDA
jgi:hypothetical protein